MGQRGRNILSLYVDMYTGTAGTHAQVWLLHGEKKKKKKAIVAAAIVAATYVKYDKGIAVFAPPNNCMVACIFEHAWGGLASG